MAIGPKPGDTVTTRILPLNEEIAARDERLATAERERDEARRLAAGWEQGVSAAVADKRSAEHQAETLRARLAATEKELAEEKERYERTVPRLITEKVELERGLAATEARLAAAERVVESTRDWIAGALAHGKSIHVGAEAALRAHDAATAQDSGGPAWKPRVGVRARAKDEAWERCRTTRSGPREGRITGVRKNDLGTWYDLEGGGGWDATALEPAPSAEPDAGAEYVTGDIASESLGDYVNRFPVPGGWLYRWEAPAYQGAPGGVAMAFVPDPDAASALALAAALRKRGDKC